MNQERDNMVNESRDKFLTEYFGGCWHEGCGLAVNHVNDSDEELQLRYCKNYPSCKAAYVYPKQAGFKQEIDYSTWQGFGWLWEKCQEQEWWNDFIIYWRQHNQDGEHTPVEHLIHPDQFADAVYEYLKEQL